PSVRARPLLAPPWVDLLTLTRRRRPSPHSSSTKHATWSRKRNVCSRTKRSARSASRASNDATISLWSTIERHYRSWSQLGRCRVVLENGALPDGAHVKE